MALAALALTFRAAGPISVHAQMLLAGDALGHVPALVMVRMLGAELAATVEAALTAPTAAGVTGLPAALAYHAIRPRSRWLAVI